MGKPGIGNELLLSGIPSWGGDFWFGGRHRRGNNSSEMLPACLSVFSKHPQLLITTLGVIPDSFHCGFLWCCTMLVRSLSIYGWFVDWEDSNEKHLSLILLWFGYCADRPSMGSNAAAILPIACSLSSCKTTPVFCVSFIWGFDSGLQYFPFIYFFLAPDKTVLLVSFLDHIQRDEGIQEDKLYLALVVSKLLVCPSGRVRGSSRGQFSAGSQFQPPLEDLLPFHSMCADHGRWGEKAPWVLLGFLYFPWVSLYCSLPNFSEVSTLQLNQKTYLVGQKYPTKKVILPNRSETILSLPELVREIKYFCLFFFLPSYHHLPLFSCIFY